MPARRLYCLIALVGWLLATPWTVAHASILLSEAQVGGGKAVDEFIELYNSGTASVSLKGYSLRRKNQSDITITGSSLKTLASGDSIPAHGYFLWASSSGIFKSIADVTTGGGLSDNNSLGLFDQDGNLIDTLTWGAGHALPFTSPSFGNPSPNTSFTRDLGTLSWSETKNISPTNSQGSTWTEDPVMPPANASESIIINEVFPNPKTEKDTGEFIELYNPLLETIDLSHWEIHDASASGKYVFPNGASIAGHDYVVVTDDDFTLSLNNTKETLSLYNTAKVLIHQVSYEKTKEGVTLNLVGTELRGGKTATPGAANILNHGPITKEQVPKKGYRDIPVAFSAKGKDADGDIIKYTWNFGDKHKSYQKNTSHTYKHTGKYTVTLTTDDGSDTRTETFKIKIEKYTPPKLRITALMPNPKGKDSDFEWIEVENREKKSIDLNGFSVATGSKKKSIVNHPIRSKFIIKGKSVRRITRSEALFTLNNERGYVELRAPTGTVIHDIKYAFEHGLKEGIPLTKESGRPMVALAPPAVESLLPHQTLARENSLQITAAVQSPKDLTPPLDPYQTTATTAEQTPEIIETLTPKESLFQHWYQISRRFFTWLQE